MKEAHRINVRRFEMPAPSRAAEPFDERLDLTEGDMRLMRKELDEMRESEGKGLEGESIARMHVDLRLLGTPEPITDRDRELFKSSLEFSHRQSGAGFYIRAGSVECFSHLALLGEPVEISAEKRKSFSEAFEAHREEAQFFNQNKLAENSYRLAELACDMRILGLDAELTNTDWMNLARGLAERRGKNGFYYSNLLAYLKLLGGPDQRLTSLEWHKMRQHLNDFRENGDGANLARAAATMKILAASSARIEPGRIVLPGREPLAQENVPPVPVMPNM